MLYESFNPHGRLSKLEELLAYWRGERKQAVIDRVSNKVFETIKQLNYQDLPNVGRLYATLLTYEMEQYITEMYGEAIDMEKHLKVKIDGDDGGDTEIRLFGKIVCDRDDLGNCLEDYSNFTDLGTLFYDLRFHVDRNDSKLVDISESESVEAVIAMKMPKTAEIETLGESLHIDKMPKQVKDAIGAAYAIKAFIKEQVPQALVKIEVAEWQVSVSIKTIMDADYAKLVYVDDLIPYLPKNILY